MCVCTLNMYYSFFRRDVYYSPPNVTKTLRQTIKSSISNADFSYFTHGKNDL